MLHSVITRFVIISGVFLIALGAGAFFFSLTTLFMTNPLFNGGILGLWLLGVGYVFLGLRRLMLEEKVFYQKRPKRFSILSPLIRLYERTPFADSLSINQTLDGCRDSTHYAILKYLVGALVFMGLLGTLWGLSKTVILISEVISHLPTGSHEGFLDDLKSHLQKPLSGMGIAFSSSLFGLGGSITLSFLHLQLEQAKDSFFQQAEEWSDTLFKPIEVPITTGKEMALLQTTLSHWLERADRLGQTLQRYEQRHQDLMGVIVSFGEKTQTLAELMKVQHTLLNKWAEEQMQSRHTLERVAQRLHDLTFSGDETIKTYLCTLSITCQELLKCVSGHSVGLLSKDIKNISK